MASSPPAVQILCRQCSAPLPLEQGVQYLTCQFCGTTNYVEKGKTVFHYAIRPTIQEGEALLALRRWMAGNETIKGLDSSAQIERPSFQYFPLWLIRTEKDGREIVLYEPAAALSISEIKHISLPAADLEPYDHELDDSAITADVPYEAMLRWLQDDEGLAATDIREVSLVHLPIYLFKYTYDKRSFTAVVDAATGKVFANIFPAKWEAPYMAIGAAAFAAYFCAALAPLVGFMVGDGGGLTLGILIYAIAAGVLAIPIFSAAAAISAKV